MKKFLTILAISAIAFAAIPQISEARIRVRAPGFSLSVGTGYSAPAASFALHTPACPAVAAPIAAPVLAPQLQFAYRPLQLAAIQPEPAMSYQAQVYQAPMFAVPAYSYASGFSLNRSFNVGYGNVGRSFAFASPGVNLNVGRAFAFANNGVNVNVNRGLLGRNNVNLNVNRGLLGNNVNLNVNRGLLGRKNINLNVNQRGGLFSRPTRIVVR